jgi:hypothetical protein
MKPLSVLLLCLLMCSPDPWHFWFSIIEEEPAMDGMGYVAPENRLISTIFFI